MLGTQAFVRSQKRRLRHLRHLPRVRKPHPGRPRTNPDIPRCRIGRYLQTKRFCVPVELCYAQGCGVHPTALRPDPQHGRVASDERHRGYQAGLQTRLDSQGPLTKHSGHTCPNL